MRRPISASVLSLLLLLCLTFAAACDEDSVSPSENDEEQRAEANVQDLWIYEDITALRRGEEPKDVGQAIVEALGDEADQEIKLIDGVHFHVFDALQGRILDPDNQVREEISVVAGLIEYDGRRALSVLATPYSGDGDSAAVGFADTLRVDLSFVDEEILAPGDALILDHAFMQGLPLTDDAVDGEIPDDLELLARRMDEESVSFLGEESGDDVQVLLYTSEVGMAVEGSTEMSASAKAQPMKDGMADGLDGCDFGLECVADFFEEFGQGAKESWDLAWDNAPDRPSDPEPERTPLPEPCYTDDCSDSWGDPHLNSVDGSRFDVMAAGEFLMLKNDDVEIQKRMQRWRDHPSVSAGTAVAIKIGEQRITLDNEAPEGERLKVNGEPASIDDVRAQGMTVGEVELSALGDVFQIQGADHLISLLRFQSRGVRDLYVQHNPESPSGEGLLGTVSGISADDFTTRDGQVYTGSTNVAEFYETFVDSWRISDEESLFDYPPGKGTDDYTDMSMPESILTIDDLDDSIREWAEAICEAAGITEEKALRDCIFDVGFGEDPTLANAAFSADVVSRIRSGEVSPTGAIAAGLFDPDAQGIETELATAPLEDAAHRLLWTFSDDTTAPDSTPDSVDVTEITDPNELPRFEVTSSYGYPNDPVFRFAPPGSTDGPLEAFETDAYVEFELTPTDGDVSLDYFYISMARGASIGDARGLHLRSSLDDFTRVIWFDEVLTERPEIERFSVPLYDVTLTETTTFRLYINSPGSNRTIEIGDIAFDTEQ